MPWLEKSPGCFERSLDPSEALFRHLKAVPCPPGRERLALTAVAQFKTDLSPDRITKALRQAWTEMRYRFPVLGASLNVKEAVKVYNVPDHDSLESWLDETIVVEAEDATPEALIANYVSSNLSKLHYLPGSSHILIRIAHWRSDGVGLCMLTNHLFAALASPQKEEIKFGDEGVRLTPSAEEIAGTCDVTDERMQAARDKWTAFLSSQARSITIPSKPFAPSKSTSRNTHVFSEGTTSDIVAACKKRGATVTTVITAVLAAIIREYSGPDDPGEHILFAPPYNIRPYMPEPYNGTDWPLAVLIAADPVEVEPLDFDDSLKQIAPLYNKDMADVISIIGAWNKMHAETLSTPPAKRAGGAPAGMPANPKITPTLNSLGVLDRYISPLHRGVEHEFKIADFWFMSDVVGPGMLIYAWTFQGRMRLTQCYNVVSFEPEYALSFMEAFKQRLLKELGVEE